MKKTFLFSISLILFVAFNSTFCFGNEEAKQDTESKENPAEKTYLLRYRFKPDETIRWDVLHRGRTQTTVSGTTQTSETVSKSTKIWKVTQVNDDGSAVFEHQVENVDMWQKMSGCEEIRYNSETDKEPPHGFESAADRVGKPLVRVTLDACGNVKERVELTAKKGQDTEGQITIPLPEEAVSAGHTWRVPHDVYVPMEDGRTKKILVHQSFTLDSVKNEIATIRVATQILTPVRDPAIEAKLIDRYRSGTVRFDIASGRILSQQMDLDKQVIGFRGPDSRVHYLTRFTEQLRTTK